MKRDSRSLVSRKAIYARLVPTRMPGTHHGPINISQENVKGRKCERHEEGGREASGCVHRSRPANALVVARSLTVHVTVPWPTTVFNLTLFHTWLSGGQTSLPHARNAFPARDNFRLHTTRSRKLLQQITRDECEPRGTPHVSDSVDS